MTEPITEPKNLSDVQMKVATFAEEMANEIAAERARCEQLVEQWNQQCAIAAAGGPGLTLVDMLMHARAESRQTERLAHERTQHWLDEFQGTAAQAMMHALHDRRERDQARALLALQAEGHKLIDTKLGRLLKFTLQHCGQDSARVLELEMLMRSA